MRGVVFACLLMAASPAAAQNSSEKFITVTGEATVTAAPDVATLRGGVTSQGKTALEASEANNKDMTAVIAALRQAGVEERAIQTTRLSISPRQENVNGRLRVIGFQANNQVTVTLRDVTKVAAVIDRMIAAGANEMSGIDFSVTDPSKPLDDARKRAVEDARRKADVYAQAAGVRLGRAVIIQEDGAAPAQPFRARMAAGAAAPVQPGEETLRVSVTVSFELMH